MLEISNEAFKRIILTDYLSNYITAGQNVRALVSNGLTRGMVSRPFIAAVLWPLGIALAAYVVYFYAKSYLDYKKF